MEITTEGGPEGSQRARVTALALDVGGTSTRVGLVASDGRIVRSTEWPTERTTLERFGRRVTEGLEAVIAASPDDRPVGVGLGVRGIIDARAQRYVRGSLFSEAEAFDLVGWVHRALGLPVRIANDVDAAALAVGRWGAVGTDFAFVNIGTGLGGAVFHDGRAIGRTGSHRELADYLVVDEHGSHRSLEDLASGQGLARQIAHLAPRHPQSLLARSVEAGRPLSAALRSAHQAHDALAERIVRDFAFALAAALVNIEAIAAPGRYVFSGGVLHDGEWLLAHVRAAVAEICREAGLDWSAAIELTGLGIDRLGLLGAAALVLPDSGVRPAARHEDHHHPEHETHELEHGTHEGEE